MISPDVWMEGTQVKVSVPAGVNIQIRLSKTIFSTSPSYTASYSKADRKKESRT